MRVTSVWIHSVESVIMNSVYCHVREVLNTISSTVKVEENANLYCYIVA